jgi:hypothetical protein
MPNYKCKGGTHYIQILLNYSCTMYAVRLHYSYKGGVHHIGTGIEGTQ